MDTASLISLNAALPHYPTPFSKKQEKTIVRNDLSCVTQYEFDGMGLYGGISRRECHILITFLTATREIAPVCIPPFLLQCWIERIENKEKCEKRFSIALNSTQSLFPSPLPTIISPSPPSTCRPPVSPQNPFKHLKSSSHLSPASSPMHSQSSHSYVTLSPSPPLRTLSTLATPSSSPIPSFPTFEYLSIKSPAPGKILIKYKIKLQGVYLLYLHFRGVHLPSFPRDIIIRPSSFSLISSPLLTSPLLTTSHLSGNCVNHLPLFQDFNYLHYQKVGEDNFYRVTLQESDYSEDSINTIELSVFDVEGNEAALDFPGIADKSQWQVLSNLFTEIKSIEVGAMNTTAGEVEKSVGEWVTPLAQHKTDSGGITTNGNDRRELIGGSDTYPMSRRTVIAQRRAKRHKKIRIRFIMRLGSGVITDSLDIHLTVLYKGHSIGVTATTSLLISIAVDVHPVKKKREIQIIQSLKDMIYTPYSYNATQTSDQLQSNIKGVQRLLTHVYEGEESMKAKREEEELEKGQDAKAVIEMLSGLHQESIDRMIRENKIETLETYEEVRRKRLLQESQWDIQMKPFVDEENSLVMRKMLETPMNFTNDLQNASELVKNYNAMAQEYRSLKKECETSKETLYMLNALQEDLSPPEDVENNLKSQEAFSDGILRLRTSPIDIAKLIATDSVLQSLERDMKEGEMDIDKSYIKTLIAMRVKYLEKNREQLQQMTNEEQSFFETNYQKKRALQTNRIKSLRNGCDEDEERSPDYSNNDTLDYKKSIYNFILLSPKLKIALAKIFEFYARETTRDEACFLNQNSLGTFLVDLDVIDCSSVEMDRLTGEILMAFGTLLGDGNYIIESKRFIDVIIYVYHYIYKDKGGSTKDLSGFKSFLFLHVVPLINTYLVLSTSL